LRQIEVARAAGLSQGAISLIERGHLRTVSIQTVRAAFAAVNAGFEGHVIWRGGELDRVLDELHAELVGAAAALLEASGWSVSAEVTFSRYGERGSIDLVATQRQLSVAVVIEAKTRLLSIEETLRRLDAKVRLAPAVVYEREGWRPSVVGRLLVVAGTSTQRRQVSRHDDVLRVAFPDRNRAVRGWLRAPAGAMHGLLFLSPTTRVVRERRAAGLPLQNGRKPSHVVL
jgi:transcriptional regulator with XRE-family HTH domain